MRIAAGDSGISDRNPGWNTWLANLTRKGPVHAWTQRYLKQHSRAQRPFPATWIPPPPRAKP